MSIYESLYQLINTYIYGGGIVLGSFQDLTAVILSTIGVVAVLAIPFVIVYKIIVWIARI